MNILGLLKINVNNLNSMLILKTIVVHFTLIAAILCTQLVDFILTCAVLL